jgi:hypothetical protein
MPPGPPAPAPGTPPQGAAGTPGQTSADQPTTALPSGFPVPPAAPPAQAGGDDQGYDSTQAIPPTGQNPAGQNPADQNPAGQNKGDEPPQRWG